MKVDKNATFVYLNATESDFKGHILIIFLHLKVLLHLKEGSEEFLSERMLSFIRLVETIQ